MTVYVDTARTPDTKHGIAGLWSHLTADDVPELHAFAQTLDLPPDWFTDGGHGDWFYPIKEDLRQKAIARGAKPVTLAAMARITARRARR